MNDYGLMAVESGDMLALRGANVAARISGLLAETTLVQKYRNDTDANLELSYTFPLPVSGTLLSFSVTIGRRPTRGKSFPVPRLKSNTRRPSVKVIQPSASRRFVPGCTTQPWATSWPANPWKSP